MEHEVMVIMIPIALCLLDVFSGYAAAIRNNELNSTKMREGLWGKVGELVAIVVSKLCDLCMTAYGDNFINVDLNTPFCVTICGIVSLYELTSVFENIGKLSPAFGAWLIEHVGIDPAKVGLKND